MMDSTTLLTAMCQDLLGKVEKMIRVSLDGSSVEVNLNTTEVGAKINEILKEGVIQASLTVRQEHGQDVFLAELETADRNCSGLQHFNREKSWRLV